MDWDLGCNDVDLLCASVDNAYAHRMNARVVPEVQIQGESLQISSAGTGIKRASTSTLAQDTNKIARLVNSPPAGVPFER